MRDTISPPCLHSWPGPINKELALATRALLSLSVHTGHTSTERASERGRHAMRNIRHTVFYSVKFGTFLLKEKSIMPSSYPINEALS